MKAIVGLGNPGSRYRHTRHNVGWQVLDCLAARWRAGKPDKTRHSAIARCAVDGEPLLLVKPLTFMNDSGRAVRALVEKDRLAPEDILVIYDDLDLQLGRIRVRAQGSAGGHRGIRSIQQELGRMRGKRQEARGKGIGAGPGDTLGSDQGGQQAGDEAKVGAPGPPAFPRIKVGIGRPPAGADPIDFVLTPFTPDELAVVRPAIERAADAAECWLAEGTAAAMNRFNGT